MKDHKRYIAKIYMIFSDVGITNTSPSYCVWITTNVTKTFFKIFNFNSGFAP